MAIGIGQREWFKQLNDFMQSNVISDSGFQSTGITTLNGYQISGQGCFYRTVQYGNGVTVTQLNIAIQVTQDVQPQNVQAVKFPAAVFPKGVSGQNGIKDGFQIYWTKSTDGLTDCKLSIYTSSIGIWNQQVLHPVSHSNGIMFNVVMVGGV